MKSRFFNVCLCVVSAFCLSFVNFAKSLDSFSKSNEYTYSEDYSSYQISPQNKFIVYVKRSNSTNDNYCLYCENYDSHEGSLNFKDSCCDDCCCEDCSYSEDSCSCCKDTGNTNIEVRNTLDNSLILSFTFVGDPCIDFSPDENFIAIFNCCCCCDNTLELWDINKKEKVFSAQKGGRFYFSADSKHALIFVVDYDNGNAVYTFLLVNLISGKEMFRCKNCRSAHFSPDGKYAIFFKEGNSEAMVFNITHCKELKKYKDSENFSLCTQKQVFKSSLHTCAYFARYDKTTFTLSIVDYTKNKVLFSSLHLYDFTISNKDKYIAFVYRDDSQRNPNLPTEFSEEFFSDDYWEMPDCWKSEAFKAEIWDINTGKKVCEKIGCEGIIFSPDDKYVCFQMRNSPTILYDVLNNSQIYDNISQFTCDTINFSRDGKHVLFNADDGRLILFNLEKRKTIFSKQCPCASIDSHRFSQSGKYLALKRAADPACYRNQIKPALSKVLSTVFRDGNCSAEFLKQISNEMPLCCHDRGEFDYDGIFDVSLFDICANKEVANFFYCKDVLITENDTIIKISEKDGVINELNRFIRGLRPVSFKKYFNSFDDFKKKVDLYIKNNFGLSLSELDLTEEPYEITESPSLKIEVFEKVYS